MIESEDNKIGKTLGKIEPFYQEDYSFLIIPVTMIEQTKYSINIKYKAKIQEELKGLYRSKYIVPVTNEEK